MKSGQPWLIPRGCIPYFWRMMNMDKLCISVFSFNASSSSYCSRHLQLFYHSWWTSVTFRLLLVYALHARQLLSDFLPHISFLFPIVFLFSAGDFCMVWKNAKLVLEFPMSVLYQTYFSMILSSVAYEQACYLYNAVSPATLLIVQSLVYLYLIFCPKNLRTIREVIGIGAIFGFEQLSWGLCHPICISKNWIQTSISPTSLAAFRTVVYRR